MRIFIILAVLIVLGGIGATTIVYQHNLEANDEIRNSILGSINQLKQDDHNINTQILEARYGLRTDYDDIALLVKQLQQGLTPFKQDKLAEYATDNAAISQTLQTLIERQALKIELIESFKSHNSILRNSIKYAPQLGERLIKEAEQQRQSQAASQLRDVNDALYRWILNGGSQEATVIKDNAGKLVDLHNAVTSQSILFRYNNHVSTVLKEQESTQEFINKILATDTQSLIEQLEQHYLDHYFTTTAASAQNLYYVFAYALLVLGVTVYLGWMLKRSYSTLKKRDSYRSQQISVAHKHLAYADNNVGILKETLHQVKDTLHYLGGIYSETKKEQKDNHKIRHLLTTAVKKYRSLEQQNILKQADDVIDKSNKNLERVSDLVKDMAV